MNRNLFYFLLVLAGLVCGNAARGAEGFAFGNYQVVSSNRVGRTEFEYVVQVRITNQVAAAQGVSAQVFSWSADTTIIEGNVSFGNVGLGASAVGADTFTIRQNRLAAFDPANLQWFVTVQSMALAVTVDAPESGLLTNGTVVRVSGHVGSAVAGVRVGGVLAGFNGTNFTALYTLEEGRNTISVVATNQYGGAGVANVIVNRDTTPPILSIDTPADGSVVASRQVTVTGQINDVVPGTVNPEQASVMVNDLAANILNRSYAINEVLLAPGKNKITAIGRDRAGNESRREIEVTFQDPASQKRIVALAGAGQTGMINTSLPEPLVVELVDGDGVVQTNQAVTFQISRSDGALVATPDSGRKLTVLTDDKGQARVLFQLGTRSGVGNNEVTVASAGVAVPLVFSASATGAPPANISALIPVTQVGEAGQPLPLPWTAFVTDAGGNPVAGAPITFTVSQGAGSLSGATTTVTNTDSDGRAKVFHTLGSEAGVNNHVVTATVTGLSNAAAVFTASAQLSGPANQTRISGVVLDNANRPMSNILCRVENTLLVTVTDMQGQFVLSNAPVGSVRLNVDARDRGYGGNWHSLQFDLVTVAGQDNRVDRPIYMLPLDLAHSAIAGGSQDVTLTLDGVPGSSLTIFAHSVRDNNGNPATNRVLWTQVNLERVPMAPPIGSQFTLAWTVQPINMRFNPPAKVCLPNAGYPPGQVLEMFGFDHDINAFVSLGQGTVTSDGSQVCSNPGFGITKSGWGGFVPPPPPCTPVCGAAPADTDCTHYETIPAATACDCPTYKPVDKVKITSVEAKVNGKDEITVGTNDTVNFSVTVQQQGCTSLKYQWDFGDGETSTTQSPTHKYKEPKTFTAKVTVSCDTCPAGSKSDDVKVIVAGVNLVIHKPKVIDSGETEIPENDELTKGAQTFINDDNDDNGTKFDRDDATVGGEDELVKVKLQIKNKDAKEGTAMLTATAGGGDIKVWKAANKDTEYTLGTALTVPTDFTVSGDMLEVTLYVEGLTAHTSQQGTKLKFTYDKATGTMDEAALTIIGLDTITFEGINNSISDNNTLDADPNWPGGLSPGSLRVFPDSRVEGFFFPSPGSARDMVTVKARLTVVPVEPVKFYFISFDVDDPTAATAPVDDDTANAEDNRGTTPAKAGKIEGSDGSGILEQAFDVQEKTFKYQVTMQPGDNFRIVGNGDKDFLTALRNDDQSLTANNADKQRIVHPAVTGTDTQKEIRQPEHYASQVLTVWRNLHLELDSMGIVTGNFLDGEITDLTPGVNTTATSLTATPAPGDGSNDGDTATQSGGRFENGTLRIANTHNLTIATNGQNDFRGTGVMDVLATPLPFTASDNDFIFGSTLAGTVTAITGGARTLTLNITAHSETPIDWPDFIGGSVSIGGGTAMSITGINSNLNQVTVSTLRIPYHATDDDTLSGDVPQPDTSGVATIWATAYVRPLFDLGKDTPAATFHLHSPDADQPAHISASKGADMSVGTFWSITLLNAFQTAVAPDANQSGDNDPDDEGTDRGVSHFAINGVIICLESVRDWIATPAAKGGGNGLDPAGGGRQARYQEILNHEIGHQFGQKHPDGAVSAQDPSGGVEAPSCCPPDSPANGTRGISTFTQIGLDKIRKTKTPGLNPF